MSDKGQLKTHEIQFWLNEASSCIERQKIELIKRNSYPLLINYYEGLSKDNPPSPHVSAETKMAIINEYFPNTNALISEIMYQNPDILLEATKPDAEEDLPLMKSALQYFFDKSFALIENRVALFDMLYAGYCAVEVDILPKEERDIIEEGEKEEEQQEESIFQKVARKIKEATNSEQAEKNFAQLAPSMESNFATVQGTYIRRYDPLDVPLDWRAERIRDRRYNLKRVWMSKAEFDAKYDELKNIITVEDEKFGYAMHNTDFHNKKVMLYEFQVRLKTNKYQTIVVSPNLKTREIDSFIRPYTTNNFNMKIGTLHKYGKLYPISMAQVNKTMQDEIINYVKHMMDVAERNVPKYVTDKNKVKGDAKAALMNTRVNEIVEVDGNTTGAVTPLQPTNVSYENKELLNIFNDQKKKLWSVSESRISGKSDAQFATEMAIQEQGFQTQNVDAQEGLRILYQEEAETGKDLIVNFWDNEVFLKVTGHPKMKWYEPVMIPDPKNPDRQIVQNPLTDMLTGDYMVKIDIASSARKDRAQQLNMMMFFMEKLFLVRQALIEQGKDINIEEIQRISKEFGWNPDKIFVAHQPAMQPTVPTATGETISPEEDARRQAEAQARSEGQPQGV